MKKEKGKKSDLRISIKQPKNFSAAFYNDYDGRIILKQADETYLKLSCCTENDIGSDIRNIFENDEYRRIKYYFDSYKGHNFSLKFVEKLCILILVFVSVSVATGAIIGNYTAVVERNKPVNEDRIILE